MSELGGRDVQNAETRKCMEYEKSLEFMFPAIASEWNYEKNSNLTPKDITAHSGQRVW